MVKKKSPSVDDFPQLLAAEATLRRLQNQADELERQLHATQKHVNADPGVEFNNAAQQFLSTGTIPPPAAAVETASPSKLRRDIAIVLRACKLQNETVTAARREAAEVASKQVRGAYLEAIRAAAEAGQRMAEHMTRARQILQDLTDERLHCPHIVDEQLLPVSALVGNEVALDGYGFSNSILGRWLHELRGAGVIK